MLFNSLEFLLFLPSVFLIYWLVLKNNLKSQNFFILISSYVFYGYWNWRFLSLLLLSTLVDYTIGILLDKELLPNKRRLLLWLSITFNLGMLFFFKYHNFFIDNFTNAISFFGYPIKTESLHLILPVGISFYTFQTLSYTIDLYKRKIKPIKDFIAFAAFVSFFPQLVAGPIERAKNLLPQFLSNRTFHYQKAIDGLRQILWGLFKKIVIADSCAEYANIIFNNSTDYNGSTLLLGAVFFAFQIYGDFSGYSDIAIGISRLFGFSLTRNFAFPYFSRNIGEFWRRWHISLSTWFRDYLYIPLGGSKGSQWHRIRNTFIVFLVSGFWHGANWTFVFWGFLNALYFLPLLIANKNRNYLDTVASGKLLPSFSDILKIAFTFSLTVVAWIFFRAENLTHAFMYLSEVFSPTIFSVPQIIDPITNTPVLPKKLILLIILFLSIEWIGREEQFAIAKLGLKWKRPIRHVAYLTLIVVILSFMDKPETYIYFQF